MSEYVIFGTLDERQHRLCQQLITKWSYMSAKETMDNFEGSQTSVAMVMMMESVLNQMGFKMLTLCLKKGFTKAKATEHGPTWEWISMITSI